MSTPGVKGPFIDGFRHRLRPGLWRVSMNPLEHGEEMVLAQRVSDGHFLMVRRDNLVPTHASLVVPNLFGTGRAKEGEPAEPDLSSLDPRSAALMKEYMEKVRAMSPEELIASLEKCGAVFEDEVKPQLAGIFGFDQPDGKKVFKAIFQTPEGKFVHYNEHTFDERPVYSYPGLSAPYGVTPQVEDGRTTGEKITEALERQQRPRHFKGKPIYGVRFAAHTGKFLPKYPPLNMTKDQAEAAVKEWKVRADTVGGDAEIVEGIEIDINYADEPNLY